VEELVALYLSRKDQGAAAELLSRYGGMVHSVIRNIVSSKADVEDVYQECWLRAFRSLKSLRDLSSFGGWLKRIAAHAALDHVRSSVKGSIPYEESAIHSQENPNSTIKIDVRQAVDSLPEHYRLAVVLYYYLDFTCAEIAQILGIPRGTVMSRLRKGRQILEPRLKFNEGRD
jgi:RNA polymerase sigma-70 factor (ECF subfamily)